MAQKKWQIEKFHYCEHVGQEVELEVQVVYPADQLPDQPPHVIAHRCSKALASSTRAGAAISCGDSRVKPR